MSDLLIEGCYAERKKVEKSAEAVHRISIRRLFLKNGYKKQIGQGAKMEYLKP